MTRSLLISVLVVEDHALLRQGLRELLESDGGFNVLGCASSGREAVAMARTLHPDVILMDIAMPDINGLEATRRILAHDPTAKVLILSVHGDPEYIDHAGRIGVVGFIQKQTSAATLVKSIQHVAGGKTSFSPAVARRLAKIRAEDRGRRGRRGATTRRLVPRRPAKGS